MVLSEYEKETIPGRLWSIVKISDHTSLLYPRVGMDGDGLLPLNLQVFLLGSFLSVRCLYSLLIQTKHVPLLLPHLLCRLASHKALV